MVMKNKETRNDSITIGWPWNVRHKSFELYPQLIFTAKEGLMCTTHFPRISVSDGDSYELHYTVTFQFSKKTEPPDPFEIYFLGVEKNK